VNNVVHLLVKDAQQVDGADLAVGTSFETDLAFAALQVHFGDAPPAATRRSSGPLGGAGRSSDNIWKA
jgi:hypothetical protein